MASSRSLLYRLEHPQAREVRDLPGDPDSIIDSVCRHLKMMLNTRQGCSITVPDYGTTDFSDVTRGYASVSKLQEEIRRSIEKYEPRLRNVQVNFTPMENEPLTMHFDISARVMLDDEEKSTMFRSVIGSNGEVRISRR